MDLIHPACRAKKTYECKPRKRSDCRHYDKACSYLIPNADRHDQMPPGLKSEVPELLFWIAVVAVVCLIARIIMLSD